jgi:hypothetical protein
MGKIKWINSHPPPLPEPLKQRRGSLGIINIFYQHVFKRGQKKHEKDQPYTNASAIN